MKRRSFLKVAALTTAVVALPVAPAAAAPRRASGTEPDGDRPGRLRYSARGGRIYVSETDGRTWRQHTNLGPDYRVRRLVTDGTGGVQATVGYGGRTFELSLAPNLTSWLTV